MLLKKEQGGTQIGAYSWPADGSVTEVPDDLAAELLAIPGGGFTVAEAPKSRPRSQPAPAEAPPPPADPAPVAEPDPADVAEAAAERAQAAADEADQAAAEAEKAAEQAAAS